MGHFKQALSDIQKANKADTANPETQASSLPGLHLPLRDEPAHHGIVCGLCAQHALASRVSITSRRCIANVSVFQKYAWVYSSAAAAECLLPGGYQVRYMCVSGIDEGFWILQEAEKRLRDIVTGKKAGSALAVNGSAARKLGSKQRQQLFVFTVRHSLASDSMYRSSALCTLSFHS